MSAWSGRRVRKARAHWRARILAAIDAGEPLTCPFYLADPQCPGPITDWRDEAWDVEHLHKRIDDGALGLENQQPAHRGCNRRDGKRVAIQRKTERATRVRSWL